jgi:cell division protein FtsI (penicillin-binding protein 3)
MIKAVRQKKRRRKRLFFVGVLVILLAAAGVTLHRLSLSLQDISSIIQLAAGKISDTDQNSRPTKAMLRGTVYDRNLNELSVSYQLFTLYIHPTELSDRYSAAENLARILGMDKDILADRLKKVQPVIEIASDLDEQQAADIEALNLKGVQCKVREDRFYPAHTTAAYLLGFADNSIGLTGVEALYDSALQPGQYQGFNVPEVKIDDSELLDRTTMDVILTIDMDLQKKVEQQLHNYRKINGAARGMALVLEPGNGRILAMVSQPGYDPNYFWQADNQKLQGLVFTPEFNRELVRPLLKTAAAIYDGGLNGEILPVTVRAPDCGLAEEKIDGYWTLFGFQQPVPSLLPSGSKDAEADTVENDNFRMLSGAQLGVGLASLMNGGSRMIPYFLHSLYNHSRDRFYEREDASILQQRVIEPAAGIHLRRTLLLQPPYSSKDGFLFTNRETGISERNGLTHYQLQEIVVAAVPRDIPKVFLLMAVEYGSLYPLPPDAYKGKKRKEDLAALGQRLLPVLAAYSASDSVAEHPGIKSEENYRRFLISRRLELPEQKKRFDRVDTTMPEVTGLSLRKALQRISPYHLKVSIKGSGRIVAQNPAPGEPVTQSGVCELTLGSRI